MHARARRCTCRGCPRRLLLDPPLPWLLSGWRTACLYHIWYCNSYRGCRCRPRRARGAAGCLPAVPHGLPFHPPALRPQAQRRRGQDAAGIHGAVREVGRGAGVGAGAAAATGGRTVARFCHWRPVMHRPAAAWGGGRTAALDMRSLSLLSLTLMRARTRTRGTHTHTRTHTHRLSLLPYAAPPAGSYSWRTPRSAPCPSAACSSCWPLRGARARAAATSCAAPVRLPCLHATPAAAAAATGTPGSANCPCQLLLLLPAPPLLLLLLLLRKRLRHPTTPCLLLVCPCLQPACRLAWCPSSIQSQTAARRWAWLGSHPITRRCTYADSTATTSRPTPPSHHTQLHTCCNHRRNFHHAHLSLPGTLPGTLSAGAAAPRHGGAAAYRRRRAAVRRQRVAQVCGVVWCAAVRCVGLGVWRFLHQRRAEPPTASPPTPNRPTAD